MEWCTKQVTKTKKKVFQKKERHKLLVKMNTYINTSKILDIIKHIQIHMTIICMTPTIIFQLVLNMYIRSNHRSVQCVRSIVNPLNVTTPYAERS